MILRTINRIPLFKKLMSPILNRWVEKKVHQFADFIPTGSKVLDLGSGNCLVANNLMKKRHNVVPIDVKDLSVVKNIKPIVYDGTKLPFDIDTFDTVLLLTVLHHTEDPKKVIIESKRVSKNIIIIEDTYKNRIQKLATQFADSMVNLGHSKMTYQNKTEKNWEKLFENLELEVISKRRKSILLFFQQTTYHLQKTHLTINEKD